MIFFRCSNFLFDRIPIVRDIIRFRTIDIDSGKLGFRVNFEKRKRSTRRKIINGEIRSAIQGAVYIFSLRRNLLQITCNSQTRIFFLTSDQSLFYVASFGARYKDLPFYFSRCVSIFIFQNFMLYFIIRATWNNRIIWYSYFMFIFSIEFLSQWWMIFFYCSCFFLFCT